MACKKYGWSSRYIDRYEIDFKDEYEKADPIDDANLNESITKLNESIRKQEELLHRFNRTERTSINEEEGQNLQKQITLNQMKQETYILRTSKTILSILHRGLNKIKQGGRIMVSDEKSAKKLYDWLYLDDSGRDTRLHLRLKRVY